MRSQTICVISAALYAATLLMAARAKITKEELGDAWPFKVSDGLLSCENSAVTFRTGGATYAINGIASGRKKQKGYADVDPIRLENTSIPGTKKDLAPIIERGRKLCK